MVRSVETDARRASRIPTVFFAQAAGEHVVARTEASDGEEPDVFMQAALPLIASLPLELFECVCYWAKSLSPLTTGGD